MRMAQEMSRNNKHLLDKVEQNIVISQCLAGQLFAKAHFLTASVTDVQKERGLWRREWKSQSWSATLSIYAFLHSRDKSLVHMRTIKSSLRAVGDEIGSE